MTGVYAGASLDPGHLFALHVDGNVSNLEELCNSGDGVATHFATYVIEVVVGRENAIDLEAIGLHHAHEFARGVRRVDENGFTGFVVPNGVDEVHHLTGELVANGKVASG